MEDYSQSQESENGIKCSKNPDLALRPLSISAVDLDKTSEMSFAQQGQRRRHGEGKPIRTEVKIAQNDLTFDGAETTVDIGYLGAG